MGFLVFTPALFFVLQAAPFLYTSYQQQETVLHPVAYRTSVTLVEDPGLAVSGSLNTSDWENYASNATAVARVGLAKSRDSPNLLTLPKIGALRNLSSALSPDSLRIELGMNASLNNPRYNVSLQRLDSNSSRPLYATDLAGTRLLAAGRAIVSVENRERVERVVAIDDPSGNLSGTGGITTNGPAADLDILLSAALPVASFTVTVTGYNSTPPPPAYVKMKLNEPGPTCAGAPADYAYIAEDNGADPDITYTHDLTSILNGGGAPETTMKFCLRVKNVAGSYLLASTDRTGAGRPVAKLVVEVW